MEYNGLREFWAPLIAYLTLLGVLFLLLGVILGACASAARAKQKRTKDEAPGESPAGDNPRLKSNSAG
jgi:hypothetical protein